MDQVTERPAPAKARNGPSTCSMLGGVNSPNNSQPPSRNQAAIKNLSLEAAVEAGNIAGIAATHFVENCEIGDFLVAEHNLRVAIAHLREAARLFRAWQGKPLAEREPGQ